MGSEGLVRRASSPPVTMDGSVVAHDRVDEPAPVPGAGTTRRTVLTRGLAVAAGALGATVVGTGVALGAMPASNASTLTLFVRDVRFRASGPKPGALHEAHAPASPHGTLVDATGQTVGSFSAGILAGSGGGIAVQRFTLADGTILGMGSGSLKDSEYAIVGGTGRYAGARGTYTTQLASGVRGRGPSPSITLSRAFSSPNMYSSGPSTIFTSSAPTSPAISASARRSSVVFPQPLGPTIETNSL